MEIFIDVSKYQPEVSSREITLISFSNTPASSYRVNREPAEAHPRPAHALLR
jgi:hypothetical protein